MNTPSPDSPEDRLLDELLREQAHGPDEAFLQQIETAVDAAPATVVKIPARRRYGSLAIAAGVGLAAGVTFFFHLQSRDAQKAITARNEAAARKEQAALEVQQLSKAIRDQEDKVEERRKVLATIAAMSANGENMDVLPSLIGKLMYVKDESRAWVLRPGYGVDGRFPMIYEDSSRQTNKSDPAKLIGPGDSFFLTGPMANRFKLLGSKVRREEMNKATNIEFDVTVVRVEDQQSNKNGVVYEFPSPLAEQRKNEFLQFDRTAVFSLEAAGMEGTEFKVEENTAFSLPPGGEKKDYLLKSITPAGVVVEMVDGGKTVDISKGAVPAGDALAALSANSAGSLRGDIRESAIKRGLDAQDYVNAKRDFEIDQQLLQVMRARQSDRKEIVPGGFANNKAVKSHVDAGVASKRIASSSGSAAFTLPESNSSLLGDGAEALPPIVSSTAGGNSPGAGGGSGRGIGTGTGAGKGDATGALWGQGAFRRRADYAAASQESFADKNSGDRYGTFIEQPWKNPARDPLSTFSIDVDTASYGNVRRMIREGRAVPKDAVRIEEFINAFSYHYAQPKGEGPFAVGATIAACPWAPGHQLVRVAIKGREIDANKRPASNLVFLIDVSGSMQSPDKLPLLKQSMAMLVEQLDERDRVAIVVYAGKEGVALPSTRLDAEGRAAVLKALSRLDAGGSTNGGAGIKLAYELAMKQKIEGGVNRVILATDGDFNVGVTGQESLVELVKDRAKGGVYLTVSGFGTGNLNDAMMDAITRDGNGNYFYIDSEREGRKVFLKNLTGTLVTIAKDLKIQVEFNPAKVGSYRLIGYANRVLKNEDFNNDKVDAGDIGAGHTVTAFYELTPPEVAVGNELKYQAAPEKPAASGEWLTVKLRHKHPEGDESSKIEFPLTGDVSPIEKADTDFQFATAAALLGMKLRGMEEVREMPWEKVLELAKPGLADDVSEDRAEFVELVKKLGGSNERIVPAPAEIAPENRR